MADLSQNKLCDGFARRLGDGLSLPHVGVTALDLSEASIGDEVCWQSINRYTSVYGNN